MSNKMTMKYITSLLLLFLLLPSLSWSQDWVVPEEKKGRLSTFPFTDETRKSGEKLYTANCMSCHGTPGKGNYLNLIPVPGDPATEKIQKNSDGEIFHKVTTGKGQMPAFRNVLTGEEIWNIVSFLRSFNKTYVQKVMQVITSAAYPGAVIRMTVSYNEPDSTVIVNALAVNGTNSVAVTGAGVRLFALRYFGHLQIDEEKTTDEKGDATFRVPVGLPGDTAGNISFSATFTDEDTFGAVSKDTVLAAGIITARPGLTAERAMWNTLRKAPVWVILSYTLGVIAVWGFILLTLMKLRDIYTIGTALRGDKPERTNAVTDN